MKSHVKDLIEFLEGSGIVERKAFLKSFVDRIEVDKVEATVVYTTHIARHAERWSRGGLEFYLSSEALHRAGFEPANTGPGR
jgi:hypothetical protein